MKRLGQLFSALIELKLPVVFVAIHTAIWMLLVPLMYATVNSENAPAGAGLLFIIDFPACYFGALLVSFDSFVANLFCLFLFGSLQWLLIGAIIAIVRKRLGF